jgi:hypothetical protein
MCIISYNLEKLFLPQFFVLNIDNQMEAACEEKTGRTQIEI